MARRYKKPKRILLEKVRPAEGRRKYAEIPREKEVNRILILLLFFAATLAVLSYGEPPLDIRVGELAAKHYIARVDFTCEDKDKTEARRAAARNSEPTVYIKDDAAIDVAKGGVAGVLSSSAEEPAVQAPSGGRELPAESVGKLKEALKKLDAKTVEGSLSNVFNRFAAADLIGKEDLYNETEVKKHLYINVIKKGSTTPGRVPVYRTLTVGSAEAERLIVEAVRKEFPDLADDVSPVLVDLVAQNLTSPTLKRSEEETTKAQLAAAGKVEPVMKVVKEGSVILPRGHLAGKQDVLELEEERKQFARREPLTNRITRFGGIALIVLLAYAILGTYVYRFQEKVARSNNMLLLLGMLSFAILVIAKVLATNAWPMVLVPLPLVCVVLSLVFGERFALMMTGLLAALVALVDGGNFATLVIFGIGGAAAVFGASQVRTRLKLMRVGFISGLALSLSSLTMALVGGYEIPAKFWKSVVFWDSVFGLGNGIFAGFVMTGLLPVFERGFGVLTDISLVEWSDLNQPILRKLVIEAPGTYHHSVVVGNMSEEAAEGIGANALLARVGSYFHDIGKLNKPEYFVENVRDGDNKHDRLSPMLSTLIITAHTKDGVAIADEFNLPKPIKGIIEEHHGTTVVEYFYEKALQLSGGDGELDMELFRYRGPKPTSREAAVVLLADSVESASRALSEPSPGRVRNLVAEITQKKLMDGQFVDSGMTLTDINKVQEALVRTLIAIFHSRVRYPGS